MKDKNLIFDGVATALITPFCDGHVDFTAFGALIDSQIERGIDALVVAGTTGESATLSDGERLSLFEFAVSRASRRVPVIAGVGCADTSRTAATCAAACELGCDALLLLTPYYNRPTPEGLLRHYRAAAERSTKPIIAYNVPARTGCNIPVPVLQKLSEEGAIAAVKEASGDLSRISKIAADCPRLCIYSGNDDQTLPIAAIGGRGVISVTSNLLPEDMCLMYRAFVSGDRQLAAATLRRLRPFFDVMFCEANPIPVKYAASLLGLCECEYRLPLCEPTDEHREAIRAVFAAE